MKKKIVVIGGGFAGLRLCKELDRKGYDVLLIDRQNHHQFQPLFYQVASARLDPSSISFPFRSIFHRSKRVDVLFAEVSAVDPEEKKIRTDVGDVSYDRLVIATGCRTNYFNNSDLEKYAFSMKTTTEAIQIRNQILLGFEEVAAKGWEACPGSDALVIVGAGPTGVELAGAFAEMKTQMLPGDFPQVDFSRLKIILIESGNETLGNMSEKSRTASGKFLEELGVTIRCGEVVASYDGLNLVLKSGEQLQSRYVIWAAGVKGNLIDGLPSAEVVRNRYRVDRQFQLNGYSDIYAIGDIAYMETPKWSAGMPQIATVAIEQAVLLAKNWSLADRGKPTADYEFHNPGSMATVGKHKAVVDLPSIQFSGRLAWFFWMFLHLMLILNAKNKLIIFINWAWSYITNNSSHRLIFKKGLK